MLGAVMMVAALGGLPESTCKTAYGDLECGWGCVARHGQLECADWPGGRCKAAYGRVECGPSAPAGGWGGGDPEIEFPPAQCIAHAGKIVCGWDCKTQFTEAKCASWPGGACVRHRDTVVCGPEAPPRWWALYHEDAEPLPKARCINKHDQVACGWNCVSRYGKVKCMPTPN
jgi:hypothetical protein